MNCAADQLKIVPLSSELSPNTDVPVSQGVEGCGQRRVYVYSWQHSAYVANSASADASKTEP